MNSFSKALSELEESYSIRIFHHQETTSTNDLAASATYGHGDIIIADAQTKGRGQRGNSWNSTPGENLTFSLVIQPDHLQAEEQFYISKIISLSLVETLAAYGTQASVKWPNDIYTGDRKIAGVLIENDLMGACIKKSIAGIGLNVNQRLFDPGLPNPTSMTLEKGDRYDRADVLKTFIISFRKFYDNLLHGKKKSIDSSYAAALYRKEGVHSFREPSGELFQAHIREVWPTGDLVLERSDGTVKNYLFKEVEFIL